MFDAKELLKELLGMRDDGHLSDALLRRAVRRIASADKKFSWTGVCGTAVAEKKNQNVPDVRKVENYIACNPDVQSEMVVLIRAGDEIFGQIDMDSEDLKAFKPEDESAVQMVADKLAEQIMAERR